MWELWQKESRPWWATSLGVAWWRQLLWALRAGLGSPGKNMETEIKKRKAVDSTSTWIPEHNRSGICIVHLEKNKQLLACGATGWTCSVAQHTQPSLARPRAPWSTSSKVVISEPGNLLWEAELRWGKERCIFVCVNIHKCTLICTLGNFLKDNKIKLPLTFYWFM